MRSISLGITPVYPYQCGCSPTRSNDAGMMGRGFTCSSSHCHSQQCHLTPRSAPSTPHPLHRSFLFTTACHRRSQNHQKMSFLGGAECSTAGNPLSQFTKHVQDDKSLQRDRLVGQGSGGLQESFRSQQGGAAQDEVRIVKGDAL